MHVSEQGLPTGGRADRTGRWYLLVLLLFAVALGWHQRGAMSILAPMIGEELRLPFLDLSYMFGSFALASTAGFLLMAVFIWREKSWLGYAVLGILGVLGALLTGASNGVGGLIVARGIAGLAYGGLLLGAYCIVGGWLPRKSHGLAIGLVFAVTQSVAPLTGVITLAAIHVGWRWISQVVAALWFLWVFLWIWLSRRSGDTLRRESHRCPVTLAQMFKDPVTWAVVVGVPLATPLLSFQSGRLLGHATALLKADRPAAPWESALVLFLPCIGAIAAGLISDALISKAWSAGKSRTALVTICGLLMSFPASFAFSRNPVISLLFAMLSVTAGLGLFAVLYTALVDAVVGRGIILGVGLSGSLSGLMGEVANMITEPVTSRSGSGPLLIGFSILTLIGMLCVRPLTRKIPAEVVPA
jgi:MFS family permease